MIYRVGSCTIDTQTYEVRQSGRRIVIEPQVFDLLVLLLMNSDRVVTKDEIIEAIWKGRIVSEAALSSRVAAARKAIGDDGKSQSLIRTVQRRGFRFVGPFSSEPSGKSSEAAGLRTFETFDGPAAKEVSPVDHVPDHAIEKTDRDVVSGERKQATVLCADIKESLERIAERDPEEALKILDAVLKLMTQAVHRYEGTVNLVTGDGIVALFGVPVTHEDHAVRACYAALQIRDEIKRYAQALQHPPDVPLLVRAGLNSGEVVTRAIASDLHTEYRTMGHTTHLAARLGQLAASGTLLLSAETLRLAEGHVEVKAPEPSRISGLDETAYELVGVGPGHTRFHVLATRGLTSFVGRSAEMEQLARVQIRAQQRHGQVVAIIGEAGLGKSRLLHEFLRSRGTSSWLVLETASLSYRKATSYQPLIRLLKTYFKIEVSDDVGEMRKKVVDRLLALDQALAPDLPALLALLDVPVEDSSWQSLDSSQRRQRTLDALKRLILRESHRQPVILAIEDLHWIDSETQAFLQTLIDSLASAPLLLVLTYRPEYEHHWGSKSYYTQVRLDMLSPEMTEEFVRNLVGDDLSLIPFKELLPKQGNPFFLEESIRTLVETNLLEGNRGAYRLVRPLQELRVPPTVQATLAARIDRLTAPDKQLLQAASVVGTDVPYAILQAIAGLEEEELRRRLANLREAEFLYETRLFPDLWYTFKHALTHEVAYGSLLGEQRRSLHRQIVDVIERLYPDRLAEQIERLAHHAFRGEVWDKAVTYLRQAGAKAFTRVANREAAAYFEQTLTALTHLPLTPETLEQGVDVRLALRNALWPLGRFETGFEHLRDAERLAKELGDQRRLGWIAAYMSEHTRQTGHAADAPTFAERALKIAEGLGDMHLRVAANYYLGTACFVAGDYTRTDKYFGTILELLKGERFRERCGLAGFPAVMSRMFWPLALAERGEFARGTVEAQEGVRLAEALDHPYSLICAMRAVGRMHGAKGDFDRAIPIAERSVALSRDRNLPQLFPEVADLLGYLYALSGRVADGLPLLEEALTALESMAMFQWRSSVLVHLGEACLLASRPDEAFALAERGLTLARERGHRGYEAWALRLLGEIAAHHDLPDVATAEAHYGAAVTLASELGMRPLVAHCHLGLGKLYAHTGERRKARQHLTTGKTMCRDMDMRFWLEMAERDIKVRQ
jgi:class 3 adenylate cyclase/tetratricopeptide (TPR) repeat protein/ABC-type cobalamin/Fe3+-siderophores transport system ATPase subunit